MPTGDQSQADQAVTVPLATEQQFGELVKLVLASESMNSGERQYWIDLLPVMTPEQTTQLQGILQSEKDQLTAIDAKYGKQIEEIRKDERPVAEIAQERKAKSGDRAAKEQTVRSEETQAAEDILKQMD